MAAITDKRVSALSQAITGVRVMKMSGWEHQFNSKIQRIRHEEVKKLQGASRFRALNEAIFFATNVSVAIVIFIVHVMMGNTITPRDVFTTFTLINVVQFTMTKFFAYAVMVSLRKSLCERNPIPLTAWPERIRVFCRSPQNTAVPRAARNGRK